MKSKIKPTRLKSVLFAALFIVIIGSIVGFYFARIQISQFAEGSNTTVDNSNINTRSMVTGLNNYIQAHQATVTNSISKIFASSQSYESQISTAVNAAASSAGVSVSKLVYGKPTSITELPVIDSAATANYVTVTISQSNYTNVIKFLQSIENSAPKMQIMDIGMTPDKKGGAQVTVNPILIGFYAR